MNIIHRDLKLGNLLLSKDKKEIKLGDFGLSSRLEYKQQRRRTICGTPNYIAPEIISAKTTHSFEVDVWSLGIIIYILLFGSAPFSAKVIKETYRKIKLGEYKFPSYPKVSDEARNLISQMLKTDSSKRITIDELNEHPFVTRNGMLMGPLDEELGQQRQFNNEETKYGDLENSKYSDSRNSINLQKKALHNKPPPTAVINHNDLEMVQTVSANKIP